MRGDGQECGACNRLLLQLRDLNAGSIGLPSCFEAVLVSTFEASRQQARLTTVGHLNLGLLAGVGR